MGGGILLPALVLPLLWAVTLRDMRALADPPSSPAVTIEITAHQWWYEVHYPEHGRTLRDELFIPSGQVVLLRVSSGRGRRSRVRRGDRSDAATHAARPMNGNVNGNAPVWFGLLGGTVAWAAHLLVSYLVVGVGCGHLTDDVLRALLVAVTVGTGLIAVTALAVAQRAAISTRTWRRSLARAGVLLDALGVFGIAFAGTLPFALRTC